jgi:hypothetical protein
MDSKPELDILAAWGITDTVLVEIEARATAWVRRWEWAQAEAEVREEGLEAARATAEEGK